MAKRNDRADSYWAAGAFADELGGALEQKIEDYYSHLEATGLRNLWELSAREYYAGANENTIERIGPQGEFDYFGVNHFRNIGQHTLVGIVGQRPTLMARASNTDFKSRSQARSCDGLFEYFQTTKGGEEHHNTCVEGTIVYGEGFRYLRWDPRAGELKHLDQAFDQVAQLAGPAYNPAAAQPTDVASGLGVGGDGVLAGVEHQPAPLYAGDIVETNPHPVDVIREATARSWKEVRWVIVRERHNRWDTAALYPQLRDKIIDAPDAVEDRFDRRSVDVLRADGASYESDEIYVYTFLHDRTPAMVNGRITRFIDADTALEESDFEKAGIKSLELVLNRMSGGEIEGSAHGYTVMFDILAPCRALNITASTMMTNLSNGGVANLTGPAGMEAEVIELARGLRFVATKGVREGKIELLDLLNLPDATFKFADWIVGGIETVTNVNSVTRGNPEASLKSGTALALVQSQFLEATKWLQAQSAQVYERWGMGLVQIFKKHVDEPRMAAIVGKGNAAYAKELKDEDIESVERVFCEMGSYLSRTTAGRVNLAEQLLGAGLLKNASDFMYVVEQGRLDSILHDETDELMLIEAENEILLEGGVTQVLATDHHVNHFQKHKKLTFNPDVRTNPQIIQAVLAHLQEHINAMQQMDPIMAALIGLPSAGGSTTAGAGAPVPPGPAEGAPPEGDDTANLPLEAANPVTGGAASVNVPAEAVAQ